MQNILKACLRKTYPFGLPYIHSRGELPYILNERNLVGEGAEIGVYYGQFSEYILTHWYGKKLYSIDAWEETYLNTDEKHESKAGFEQIYQSAKSRLSKFGDRSEMIRKLSSAAVHDINDKQLDFVYIDAGHTYEEVLEDLHLWFPKVKTGGVLAGHDFLDGPFGYGVYGVKSAVIEFAKKNALKVYISRVEPETKSWFLFL